MSRRRLLGFATASLVAAVAVACADEAPREAFEPTPEVHAEASLPPPSTGAEDASPPTDAALDAAAPDAADEPVVCSVSPCAKQVVMGAAHACALMSDGTIQCWGQDTLPFSSKPSGALGRGALADAGPDAEAVTPARVVDVTTATQVSARESTSCARLADGSVQCWGKNDKGQLGLSASSVVVDNIAHFAPAPVALGGTAIRADVGERYSCAVRETGGVECWGTNAEKELARDTDAGAPGGPALAQLSNVALTSGTVGRTTTGELVAWGAVGLLGRASSTGKPSATPTPIPGLSEVTSLSARTHACAIAGGEVQCWGPDHGAICSGVDARLSPQLVVVQHPPDVRPQQVWAGGSGTCVRLTDGTVQCCGDNSNGQLALGDGGAALARAASLTRATALTGHAVMVVSSDDGDGSGAAVCALLATGAVVCWGSNSHGLLGGGAVDAAAHPIPTAVVFQN